jgi:hypothetical protein
MNTVEEQTEWIDILKNPTTTVKYVNEIYMAYPRLTGHMVEDLFWAKRIDLLQFFYSVNWFCMAGRDLCAQLLGNRIDTS